VALASANTGARAQEPAEYRAFLSAGYGTQDDEDAGSFGPAFGLKLGYVPIRFLHLGVHGTYHVGSEFGPNEINRVHYLGAEGGARLADERVGVTPYLAFGVASVSSQRNAEDTFATYYYGAGIYADVSAIDWLTFGVDVRLISFSAGVRQSDNQGNLSTIDVLGLAGLKF
jgi:hypothetical protein